MRTEAIGLLFSLAIVGCGTSVVDDSEQSDQAVKPTGPKAKPIAYLCTGPAIAAESNVMDLPSSFRMRANASELAMTYLVDAAKPARGWRALEVGSGSADRSGRTYVIEEEENNKTTYSLDRNLADSAKEGRAKIELSGPGVAEIKGMLSSAVVSMEYSCSALPERTPVRPSRVSCKLAGGSVDPPKNVPQNVAIAFTEEGATVTAGRSSEGKPNAGAFDDPMSWSVKYTGFPDLARSIYPWMNETKVHLSKSLLERGVGAAAIAAPSGGDGTDSAPLAQYDCVPGAP